MTKPKHKDAFKIIVIFIALILIHAKAFSHAAPLWLNNTVRTLPLVTGINLSYTLNSDSAKLFYDKDFRIECPKDISVFTAPNSCSAEISRGLNIKSSRGVLTLLTWKMTGATEGSSRRVGINQINNYVFNKGTTLISYTASDNKNNTLTCSFAVTVADNQAPRLISSPGNKTAINIPGECYAKVFWSEPIVTDNCVSADKITIRSNYSPGDIFPVGATEVVYNISDGTNELIHRFTVTVIDAEPPRLTSPAEKIIICGEQVEDAFTKWEHFEKAGGKVLDNCEVDYSSFRYMRQISSGIHCPYTITRTYSIADIHGNIAEVNRIIHVTGEEPETKEEETEVSSKTILKSGAGTSSVTINLVNITHVSCFGGSDGAIDLDTASTNGPITSIVWDHGPTTLDLTGLSEGTYTIRVTDGDGTEIQNFNINQPNVLNASVSLNNITCNGANDGTITVSSPTGGNSGTYEVSINGTNWYSVSTVSPYIFSNLSQASYTVRIRDAGNPSCVVNLGNQNITQPAILSANVSSVNVTCNGANDGTITVSSPTGGYGTYDVSINGTNWFGVSSVSPYTFNGLAPSGYTVQIRDAANTSCVVSLGSQNITEPAIPIVNDPSDQTLCNGNTTTTVTFTGTASFYEWTNNNTSIGLSSSGTGNIASFTAINSGNSPEVATIEATPVYNNSGIYCYGTPENFTITVNPTPDVVAVPASETICSGSSSNISLSGSVSGTSFSWTVSQSGVTGASAGSGNTISQTLTTTGSSTGTVTYTVIPNANGCNGTPFDIIVTVNPIPDVIATPGSETVCSGSATNISLSGSVAGTTFNWTVNQSGASGASAGSGNTISQTLSTTGPSSGTVTYTVTPSANGCTGTPVDIIVTVNTLLNPSSITLDQNICYNTVPQSLVGTAATGGSSPYGYQWQQSPNGTGSWTDISSATNLTYSPPALTTTTFYRLEATDLGTPSCGTEYSNIVEVNVAPELTASDATTAILCNGGSATVTITANGGTPPYSYVFNGVSDSDGIIPNVTSGTYNWSVSDALNCGPVTGTINITEPTLVTASIAITDSINCNGETGEVTITASGGTPPYEYTFNGVTQSSGIFSGILAGTNLTWSVRDANGCQYISGAPVNMIAPDALVASAVATDVLCNGDNTGSIDLTVNGGTLPYSFVWDNGAGNGEDPTGLTANTYNVTITDAKGCTTAAFATVDEPAALSASVDATPVLCYGQTSNIQINAGGGTTPYTYTFDGVSNATGTFSGIGAATGIAWQVEDANGCIFSGTHDVVQPAEINITSISAVDTEICEGENIVFSSSANGGTGTLTYKWEYPDGTIVNNAQNPTVLNANVSHDGTYTLTVTDVNNCSKSTTIDIIVNPNPTMNNPGNQVVCGGGNIGPISFSGATNYSWTNDNTDIGLGASGTGNIPLFTTPDTFDVALIANIIVTPESSAGCSANPITFTITVNPTPVLEITNNTPILCDNGITSIVLSSNVAGTTYSWTGDDGSSGTGNIIEENISGDVTYTITPSANGCVGDSYTADVTVVSTSYDLEVNPVGSPSTDYCGGASFSIDFRASSTGSGSGSSGGFSRTEWQWLTRFMWSVNNPNVVVATSGGPIGNGTVTNPAALTNLTLSLINNTDEDQVATISITPWSYYRQRTCFFIWCNPWTSWGPVCSGDAYEITITVHPFAIECPTDIEVNTDLGDCDATLTPTNPVISCDPGSNVTWSMTGSSGDSGSGNIGSYDFPAGTTTVTYRATESGVPSNFRECTFDVTVNDVQAPAISNCPTDINQTMSSVVCGDTVTFTDPVFTDNCDGVLVANRTDGTGLNSGDVFPVGTTTITWYAADAEGNDTTCSFNVTILPDATGPEISCVGNQAGCAPFGGTYLKSGTDWNAVATDNCPGVISLTYNLTGATSGTGTSLNNVQFNVGTTTVEWTATDIIGNNSNCSFDVVVTEAPGLIIEPVDVSTCLNGSATFTISAGGIPTPTCQWRFNGLNISGATDTFLILNNVQVTDAGNYDVVLTNSCGTAISEKAELSVSTPPVISVQPASQTDCLGENIEFTVVATGGETPYSYIWEMRPTPADAWNDASTVTNISVADDLMLVSNIGDSNNPDQAQYRVIVTDACGNSTTSSVATLTVNQIVVPAIIDSVTVCQDGGATFSVITSGSAPVTYEWQLEGVAISNNAVYSGATTQTLTINNAQVSEGGTYSVRVTFNITQPNNNGAGATTCESSFVDIGELIVDEGPDIVASIPSQTICPGSAITQIDLSNANGTPGTTYSWTRNNTGILTGMPANGTGSTINGVLNSLTPETMVTTTFVITALANGCPSTTSVTVTVGDTIAPVLASCPADIIANTDPGSCDATVSYILPTFDDDCEGTGLPGTLVEGLASGSQFPIGSTSIKYVYTDVAGNVSDTCSFNVIITDNEPPNAVCQNITVQLDVTGSASITANDVDSGSSDGCGLDSLRIDISTFDCTDIGANTIILTAVDMYGNEASCSAIVTVADTVKPVVVCQDIDAYLDINGQVIINSGEIDNGSSDNCGIANMSLSTTDFTCSEVGLNSVTLTVTDDNGNSNSCNANVNVLDTISPVASCQDITIQLNAFGKAGISANDIDNGSSDNCGIATMSVSIDSFDCSNVGANLIILTITDAHGNSSNCTSTVTVEDTEKPVAICNDITIQLDAAGLATIIPADVDNGSTDNCGVPVLSVTPNSFDCTNLGPNTVVLTATDTYGNDSTCQAIVTVADDLNPVNISASVSQQPILCNGELTDVTITVSGGVGILTYTFDGVSQAGNTFSNIAAGIYNWSVTDAFGCGDTTGTFEVVEPDPLTALLTALDATCSSGSDGEIRISASGGSNAFEFSIDGGGTWQTDTIFTGLAPGFYNVQMRDQTVPTCSVVLDPNLEIIILDADIVVAHIDCYGGTNGEIAISNPDGGSGAYQFTINGGTSWENFVSGTYTYTGLSADTFDVWIRDANDLSCLIPLDTNLIITQPDSIHAFIDSTNITCFNANNGSITFSSPTGGTGVYEYSINGGTNWSSGANFTNLTPGTFDVRIRDTNNCEKILNSALVLIEPAILSANIDSSNISCNGSNDGEIILSNPAGGYGTYEFSIDGGTNWQADTAFLNLIAGTYDVRIRDAASPSCNIILDASLVLSEPPAMSISSQPNNLTDCYGSSISFGIAVTGGAGTISYEWQRMKPSESVFTAIPVEPNVLNQDTDSLLLLNIGNADAPNGTQYRVIVTDNCTSLTSSEVTLTVNEITAVTPDVIDTEICEGQNYSLQVSTSGDIPTLYQWQIDTVGTWENLSNTAIISGVNTDQLNITGASPNETGQYRVVVTFPASISDCNLSSESFVRNLTVHPLPEVDPTADLIICNGDNIPPITFTGTATSYDWTNDNSSIGLVGNGTGNIASFSAINNDTIPISATIIVTPRGLYCDGIPDTFNITINPTPLAVKPVGVVFCDGFPSDPYPLTGVPYNVVFDITGGGAIGIPNSTDVTEIPSFIPIAGTANVTITPKLNGCVGTPVSFNILVMQSPTATISGGDTVCQGAAATSIVFVNQVASTVEAMYTINGTDTNTVVMSGFSPAQVPVATNVPGVFLYELVSVRYITAPFCANPDVRDSARIVVIEPPTPIITGPASVCALSGGHVYRTESGMTNYVWNISTGAVITAGGGSSDSTITVTWNSAGNKNVSVRYTDNNSCSAALPTIYPVTVNALPTPTITGSGDVCEDEVIVYTTQSGRTNYTWIVNGGQITAGGGITDNSVTIMWDSAGVQTVSVNYVNASGCTADSAILSATLHDVLVHPEPEPSVSGADTACTGDLYVYTSDAGMSNYIWTVSAGGNIVSGGTYIDNTATVRWNVAGSQSISVNYTDADGCTASADSTLNVTVHQSPVPVINGPALICAGSANATYRTESGMTNYIWTVSTGGTITGGANDSIVYVTWNSIGNHTISVDYTNENNCNANTPSVLNVVAVAEVIPVITGVQTVCEGTTGNYTTESGMLDYNWTVVGGTITAGGDPTSNSVTILWDSVGVQTVSVDYLSTNGCNSIVTDHNVTVNAMPHPTITGETSACLDAIVYTYSTEAGMTSYQWIYSAGAIVVGGGSSTDDYIDIMWNALGAQSVSVNYSNANGCRAISASTSNIIVNELTPVTCPGDTTFCVNAGLVTLVEGIPAGGAFSGPGVTGNIFDPAVATVGLHTITYSYTNDSNCVSSCNFEIRVDPQPIANDTFITICSEYPFEINLNDIVPDATFSWIAYDNSGPGATVSGFTSCASSCDTLISDILINSSISEPVYSTGTAGTVVYEVTALHNGCGGTFNIVVTVEPSIIELEHSWNSNFVEDFIEVCAGAEALSSNDLEILHPTRTSGYFNSYGLLTNGSYFNGGWNPTILYGQTDEGPWIQAPHGEGPSGDGWNDAEGPYQWIVDFAINDRLGYHYFIVEITDPNTGCIKYSEPAILYIVSSLIVEAGGPDYICTSSSPVPLTLEGAYVGGISTTSKGGTWTANVAGGSISQNFSNPGNATYTPPADYIGDIILTLTSNDPDGSGECVPLTDTRTITVLPPNSFEGCLDPLAWPQSGSSGNNGYLDDGPSPCAVNIVGSNNSSGSYGIFGMSHCSGSGYLTFDWYFKAPQNKIVWHQEDQQTGLNSGSSSMVVSRPSNVEAGDLIIVTIHINDNNLSFTPPSGFSLILNTTHSSRNATVATFRKIAGSSEPGNYTFNVSGGSVGSNDRIYASRVTGHNQSNPIGNSSGLTQVIYPANPGGYNGITISSVNTTIANSMLVATMAINSQGTSSQFVDYVSSPIGMSTMYYEQIETTTRLAHELIASAGATGDKEFLWPSYNSRNRNTLDVAAQMFVINPAIPDVDAASYLVGGTPVVLGNTNGASGSVSVPVTSGDDIAFAVSTEKNTGGPGILTIYNLSVPNDPPVVSGDTLIEFADCQPVTFDPDTAFQTPIVVDDCGIDSLQVGFPVTSAITTIGCENWQTRTWLFVDDCGLESDTFTQRVVWTVMDTILLTCAPSDTLPACVDAADIQLAYDAWKAGFSHTGGCETVFDNINEFPVLTDLTCGGQLEFTLIVTDNCGQVDSCTSYFVIQAAADLALTCPNDTLLPACSDTTDIRLAYETWISQFDYSGGCSSVTTNIDSIPELTDLSCGGQIEFRYIVNLGSPSCPNSIDCIRTFGVEAPEDLEVVVPPDASLPLCSDTASIRAAYNIWVSAFNTMGGCDVITNIDSVPELPDLTCGGSITFVYQAQNGDGKCFDTAIDSSTFSVLAPPPLTMACPPDPNLPGCSGIIAITNAYNDWVDGFTVSGGCDVTSNIDSIPPLGDLLCDGQLSFTFIATNGIGVCADTVTCSSTFTLGSADSLEIFCPGDTIVEGCTAAEVQPLFDSWIAQFGFIGGCNVNETDLSIYVPPVTCGGSVVVNYIVSDDCGQTDSCFATFQVQAPELTITLPNDTLLDACQSQLDIDIAFANWISQFSYSGGCNVLATDTSLFFPPDICGGDIIINYSATDACGQVKNGSAFFAIDIPKNVDLNPSFTVPANTTIYSDFACNYDSDPVITGWPTNLTDNCTEDSLMVTFTDSIVDGTCIGSYIIYRSWTVIDNCGNDTTQLQLINVTDTIPPVIVCPNDTSEIADPTFCYKTGMGLGQATATDNCTPDASIVITNDAPAQLPVGTTLVTWTATDDCGNSSTCTQNVTIIDITPPEIEITGCQDVSDSAAWNFCSKVPDNMNDPVYHDDCWPIDSLTLTYEITGATTGSGTGSVVGLTFNVGVSTVTYTVSDPDGNQDSCSFTVTILDVTPPGIDIAGCQDVSDTAAWNNCSKVPDNINDPIYSDNCWPVDSLTLIYEITGATTGSGTGSVASLSFNVGISTVKYVVSDPDGNQDSCSFTVRILDVTPPGIDIGGCIDVTETAPPNNCSKTPTTIPDPTYSDNCWPVDSLTLTWTMTGATSGTGFGSVAAETFNVGVTTVQYVVSDPDGNSDSCSFTVTILDVTPPAIDIANCVDVTDVAAPNNCSKVPGSMVDPTYSDACWPVDSLVLSWTMTDATTGSGYGTVSDSAFNVGVTTVVYTVTDPDGNFDFCSFTVTILDITPPFIEITGCQDVTETMGPDDCFVIPTSINDPVFHDDCWPNDSLLLTYTITGATTGSGVGSVVGETFNIGVSTVEYIVIDPDGNSDTCSFTVTMLRENIPPAVITCPSSLAPVYALPGLCEAPVTLDAPTIVDPCATATYTIVNDYNNTDNASDTYPSGITTVVWTITDNSGKDTTCIQIVEVIDDQPPVVNCPPDVEDQIISGGCDMISSSVGDPTFSDNCAVDSMIYILTGATAGSGTALQFNYASAETFNVGITTVTYIVFDESGLTDTCSHTVWIKNLNAPQFSATCPPDVTAYADPGLCEADLVIPVPTIVNPCNEAYTVSNDWPFAIDSMNVNGIYPVGITVITWTITDASGNVTTCVQTIEVIDDQPPVVNCPPDVEDQIINGGCDMISSVVGDPTFSDNCTVDSLIYILTGATTGTGTALQFNYASGETFNVGITRVTYIAFDAAGLTDTCSHTVWIKNLNAPQFSVTCPPDVTAYADPGSCDADLVIPVPTIVNPCNEAYTVSNDWPFAIDSMNVNGIYPVGITVITWTITDASGNVTTCIQTIEVIDDQPPVVNCPPDVEDQIINGGCDMISSAVGDPTFSDNCAVDSLIYILTGATTGSGTALQFNYASGEAFNVGVTTVTYIVFDAGGLTDTCSHTVWIKNLASPNLSAVCPPDVVQDADPGECYGTVSPPVPVINNPCNEAYWVTNDWPSAIDSMNIDGIYPIGTTTVTWTITDASGNVTTCIQNITINDLLPTLVCPPDITVQADFEKPYASGIVVGLPTFDDNCPDSTLTYIVTAPSGAVTIGDGDPSGINMVTGPNTYELGTTEIEYTFTDAHGHVVVCSHFVTVLGAPVIECPPDTLVYADANCEFLYDPGVAELIEGSLPITWTWTLINPDGSILTGGSITPDDGPEPLPIVSAPPHEYNFQLGITTITWTAVNVSGGDTCSHIVEVIDTVAPVIINMDPLEECVETIYDAEYLSFEDIQPARPDYYRFVAGSIELDIDVPDYSDNCDLTVCTPEVHWRIDFEDGSSLPAGAGTYFIGQPSVYGSDIYFPGDPLHLTNVIHTISYWIVDCNGNVSDAYTRTFTVMPRPRIVKTN